MLATHSTAFDLYDPAFEHDSCGIGLVAHIKGEASHAVLRDACTVLERMEHRGACGCETDTGDGSGVMTALPHAFLSAAFGADCAPGEVALAMCFLPSDAAHRARAAGMLETALRSQGCVPAQWRDVDTDADGASLGPTSRASQPHVAQLLVRRGTVGEGEAFETALYVARRQAEKAADAAGVADFYVCSLSSRTVVYKGMLTPHQLSAFYPDLRDPAFETHFALVHSRFSTNTFPSWDRAQPLRMVAHNGEINTLRGNRNAMDARRSSMRSERLGASLADVLPLFSDGLSDSGTFDRALELMRRSGRSLPHAMARMIPPAWEHDDRMPPGERAFYAYGSHLMEPWDGPAAMVFTDGKSVGAVLDRNGLRPSRYYVTTDDRVILSSEVGVLPDLAPEQVREKGRLAPGKLFFLDFDAGRIVPDAEVKQTLARRAPYRLWMERQLRLADLPSAPRVADLTDEARTRAQRAFDYSDETIRMMLIPMLEQGRDPLGSMGNDEAPAVLSAKPRGVFNYFKQLFAQVTNPPIDAIREACVMSLAAPVGPAGNLLAEGPDHARRLLLDHPVLDSGELAQLTALNGDPWMAQTLDATFDLGSRNPGESNTRIDAGRENNPLVAALDRLCEQAAEAVAQGIGVLVVSDRAVAADRVPIPSLLALGAIHHDLVARGLRSDVMLVVETGEARTVHHLCCLIGYGADAIHPYLVLETLDAVRRDARLPDERYRTRADVVTAYRKATGKGILKVMGKMGISTLASYRGAGIFEALGLGREVVARCFPGTPSRIGGVGWDGLLSDALARHASGYGQPVADELPSNGRFHYREGAGEHAWSPAVLTSLQQAARHNSRDAYDRYARLLNDEAREHRTLRGLFGFTPGEAVPIGEVEPASEIVQRFVTGAMSLGSLSPEAHESLAVAMNRIGGKSNTGEGGEDPARAHPLPNGDSKRSAIKQVASGRFGVTIGYLSSADEIQIKMAQGAKPGEGGELPGHKVDATIARLRFATPGVGLVSPPPHHDIYSIEDLKQLIFDLKNANPDARISVKLVSEVGVGTVAAGVAKGGAEHILVSGDAGGTGASALTSIKHAGLPWELGLAEAQQTLVRNGLRGRVVVQTDGGLRTGRDAVVAALLGAEEFGFSTAPLISLGCIMMRKCHLNTCPVGIATQNPALRSRFAGEPEHVVNYLFLVAEEMRALMARLGFRTVAEMVGRVDRLDTSDAVREGKLSGLDLSPLLAQPTSPYADAALSFQAHIGAQLDDVLDQTLIARSTSALSGERVDLSLGVSNLDRAVGTMLSGHLTRAGADLADDAITLRLQGSAGQSLGAFLAKGVTIRLAGDANDYVGKGLSGGIVALQPPDGSPFQAEDQVIAGNVLLYGATGGELYARGRVAERFAVRNSGAWAVCEGAGDHALEYMTGGRVAILGPTGRNACAGMSGGVAFVFDPDETFASRCNTDTVDLEPVGDRWAPDLLCLLTRHAEMTGSPVAGAMISAWPSVRQLFTQVMPRDYRRVLEAHVAAAAQAARSVS